MDMRSSLDWDFKSRRSILVTRRSKDHGEENQSVLAGNMSQGRSQYGPSERDMGGHSRQYGLTYLGTKTGDTCSFVEGAD